VYAVAGFGGRLLSGSSFFCLWVSDTSALEHGGPWDQATPPPTSPSPIRTVGRSGSPTSAGSRRSPCSSI